MQQETGFHKKIIFFLETQYIVAPDNLCFENVSLNSNTMYRVSTEKHLSLLQHSASHAAQKFRSNANVRGDLFLGKMIYQGRVSFAK